MQIIIDSFKRIWNNTPKNLKIGGSVLVALVFMSLLFVALFSSSDYQILYSDLSLNDASAIVAILNDNGVAYEISNNGSAISVPSAAVHETRFLLASQGLPSGGIVGYEIFDSTRLGETEADRELRSRRALEGELMRSIQTLNEVDNARVHLVIPPRSLFVRESQPSTATVLLTLKQGVVLSNQQVSGIAHLLATSVERLLPENITIVDTRGNVLNDFSSTTSNSNIITQRLEIEGNLERQLASNITAMLERIYGYGKVISLVNVELDFDSFEKLDEIFTPPTRDGGLVRSQQSYSELFFGDIDGVGGIPGVESNIPGYVQVLEDSDAGYYIDESITNYELNRSEVHHISSPGSIERLSVSVWVNGELTSSELEAVESSVVSAIGMDLNRGDHISVNSVPFESDFSTVSIDEAVEGPSYIMALVILLLLLVFLVIALLLRARRKSQIESETLGTGVDLIVDDQAGQVPEISPEDKTKLETVQRLKNQVRDKPEEFVKVLKSWLADD